MIRRAGPEDAWEIARIHVGSWQAAYRGILPDAYLDGISVAQWAAPWPARLTDASPSRAWLLGEPAVGVASDGPCRDSDAGPGTGEIYMIYLLPMAWGTGFGRMLLDRALADLAERGFTVATLWVLMDNTRARHFYEAAGGVLDGPPKIIRVGDYPVAEVRYRYMLSPPSTSMVRPLK